MTTIAPSSALLHALSPQRLEGARPAPRAAAPSAPLAPQGPSAPPEQSAPPAAEAAQRPQRRGSIINILA